MPVSDIHKKKRRKNLVLLALIFAWCALIWAVTMVKLARAEDAPPAVLSVACTMDAKQCPDGSYVARSGPDCAFAACPGDSPAAVEVEENEASIDDIFDDLEADEFADDETMTDDAGESSVSAGERDFIDDHGKWAAQREAHRQEIVEAEKKYEAEMIEHQKFIEAQPSLWWENWQDKLDPEK